MHSFVQSLRHKQHRHNRMRRVRSFVLLCTLAAVVPLAAQAQTEIENVGKLLSDQVKAWNRGDIEGFMKGYWNSDSTIFVSGGNLSRGYNQLLARYKKTYDTREKMGKLDFTDLAIRTISSRAAIVTGVFRLYRSNDQPWGRFTLVVEKKPEGWRITHDHTSSAAN